MGRQDGRHTATDRLVLLERWLRGRPGVLVAAAAVSVLAASGHAITRAPELAWLSIGAVATAGLASGGTTLLLAAAAALLHSGVDLAIGRSDGVGASLLRLAGFVGVAALATSTGIVVRRYEQVQQRSQDVDAATGLLNAGAFYDGLHGLRAAGHVHAVLLADIAGMRNLTERYGHPAGTAAMRALGAILRRSTKHADLVARLDSDEIAVALVGADRDGALAATRRLARLLATARVTLPDGSGFRVRASYGIATSAGCAVDAVSLLRAADHARLAARLVGTDEIGVAADTAEGRFEIVHPQAAVTGRLRDLRSPPSAAGTTGTSPGAVPRPTR